MSEGVQLQILGILQVEEIECHDRYLGLPSVVGASKKAAFASIKDNIWRRIQGLTIRSFQVLVRKF